MEIYNLETNMQKMEGNFEATSFSLYCLDLANIRLNIEAAILKKK